MNAATLRIAIPAPSFVPPETIEKLQHIAYVCNVDTQLETYVARSIRFDSVYVTGEAETRAALTDIFAVLWKWGAELTSEMLLRLAFRIAAPELLIESVGPIAGKGDFRAQVKDSQEVLTLLERRAVLPYVTRVLLSPDRTDILADIGKYPAYLLNLDVKSVTVAPGARDVPEPKA